MRRIKTVLCTEIFFKLDFLCWPSLALLADAVTVTGISFIGNCLRSLNTAICCWWHDNSKLLVCQFTLQLSSDDRAKPNKQRKISRKKSTVNQSGKLRLMNIGYVPTPLHTHHLTTPHTTTTSRLTRHPMAVPPLRSLS